MNGVNSKKDTVTEKLLPENQNPINAGSPVIKIRNPGSKSHCYRSESIRLKRFDLISDDISPIQAAREGRLKVLQSFLENGDNLNERDSNGYTPIHYATRANQINIIEFLLDNNIEPDIKGGPYELTPLHISVRFNCYEAAKVLLTRGADPSIKSTDGSLPLHFAARHGSHKECELLLGDKRSDVNVPDNSGVTPFHLACVSGNVELCELFLDHEADIFAVTAERRNSLHIASSCGHSDIVRKLIQAAIDQDKDAEKLINSCDATNNTPLHLACKKGHVEAVKILLKHDADLDARNDIVSNTPLHIAAQAGQVEIVQILIDGGGSVSSINALRRLPIHLASLFGHLETVNCLLENGSPIEPRDSSSLTPLLSAVSSGRLLVVDRLIKLGADTDVRTESLQTCIHLAIQNKKMDMVQLLVHLIGNEVLDMRDKDQRVPLHLCAYSGQYELLQFLLAKGASPHPKDIFGRTPLHMAAENGNFECLKALADKSPLHIGDTDDTNTTPLQEAAKKGHRIICKYLLSLGADVTSKDSNRWTALHHAACSGHVGTIETLLKAKTVGTSQTIDEQDSEGHTPLIIAARNGHVDVVRLLIDYGADVTIRNKRKMTCLDEAVENDMVMVVMEIVKSERWFDIVTPRPYDDKHPMKVLIEKMPQAANSVLDRCIKNSDLPSDNADYQIECDFRLLDSSVVENDILEKKLTKHFFAPSTMIKSERESLLSHPLVRAYLALKWKRMGRPITNLTLLLYLIYVIVFTTFLVSRRKGSIIYRDNYNKSLFENQKMFKTHSLFLPVFITIIVLLQVLKEIFQMFLQGFGYFKSMDNYFDWASYFATTLFMIPHLYQYDPYITAGAMWPIGATAVLFIYSTLILYLRSIGSVGIYISMFIEILKTMGRVLTMFTIFVFSFALVFYTLLKEQAPFKSLGWSFVKTTMMVIGDIDYDGIIVDNLDTYNQESGAPYVPAPLFTSFILMVFSFFMAVLFMNLLVGLAVGDIDGIRRNASFKRKAMQVELIVELETRYPRILGEICGIKPIMVFKPNEEHTGILRSLYNWLYCIDGSIFRSNGSPDNESDVASDLSEQKLQIKELQKSLQEQKNLLVSMAKQLKDLSTVLSPGDVHLISTDTVDTSRNERVDQEAASLIVPPSLL